MARQLIQLSGFSVLDDTHPPGDIELKFTGLRPGEKLYEELLIGLESTKTSHPLISKAREEFVPSTVLDHNLDKMKVALKDYDNDTVVHLLRQLVPEYQSLEFPSFSLPSE